MAAWPMSGVWSLFRRPQQAVLIKILKNKIKAKFLYLEQNNSTRTAEVQAATSDTGRDQPCGSLNIRLASS